MSPRWCGGRHGRIYVRGSRAQPPSGAPPEPLRSQGRQHGSWRQTRGLPRLPAWPPSGPDCRRPCCPSGTALRSPAWSCCDPGCGFCPDHRGGTHCTLMEQARGLRAVFSGGPHPSPRCCGPCRRNNSKFLRPFSSSFQSRHKSRHNDDILFCF